ncbi:hypothetical protein DIPPA_34974 [Diplonema papillatum]|nr:hypothetical protein DIPPA_34974 [Diplonema papillatum]
MGKTFNKKAKRVLLSREKVKTIRPEGKQTAQSKALVDKLSSSAGKKARYRGKNRTIVVKEPEKKEGEESSLGAGVLIGQLTEGIRQQKLKKRKTKEVSRRGEILKSVVLSDAERAVQVNEDTEHFARVLNSDDFKKDPSAAVLKHLEATLDPLEEATGRHRYNPSQKKKRERDEELRKRNTADAQLADLTGFQSKLNATEKASPYPRSVLRKKPQPAEENKPKKKMQGRRAGSKPWLAS